MKIDGKTKQAILRDLLNGIAVCTIVSKYPGVGVETINRIADQLEIPRRRRRKFVSEQEDAEVKRLYSEGLSTREIADQLGMAMDTVRQHKYRKPKGPQPTTSNPAPREWLKEFRESAKMTMQQVADKIGISRQYYHMIERGLSQKDMDITLAVKLAEIFSVDVETILDKEQELAENKPQEIEEASETETHDTRREIALILAEALEVTAEYLRGIAREE